MIELAGEPVGVPYDVYHAARGPRPPRGDRVLPGADRPRALRRPTLAAGAPELARSTSGTSSTPCWMRATTARSGSSSIPPAFRWRSWPSACRSGTASRRLVPSRRRCSRRGLGRLTRSRTPRAIGRSRSRAAPPPRARRPAGLPGRPSRSPAAAPRRTRRGRRAAARC